MMSFTRGRLSHIVRRHTLIAKGFPINRKFHLNNKYRQNDESDEVEREQMEYDVLIVGGGPSGLTAAIRMKQLAAESGKDVSVGLIDKGQEIGSHILSGAVIDPTTLKELFPEDWNSAPLDTKVTRDQITYLTATKHFPLPVIPQMDNHGNYIISLAQLCKWLSTKAEEAGVDIFPGFSGSKLIYENGDKTIYADHKKNYQDGKKVVGIVTGDAGIGKDGKKKDTFEPGIELRAKYTLLAEGARGSLTKVLYRNEHLNLRKKCDPQTFALGVKEIWEVDPNQNEHFENGLVAHTQGWPMDQSTYGGSWMYHYQGNRISMGFVVALDYKNPTLSPYQEFQRFKHHPFINKYIKSGKCIHYGARSLSEGGYYSIPKLTFPGGALIGDCAGFLNVPKIKGIHTNMKSGLMGAEATFEALQQGKDEPDTYQQRFESSWLYDELYSTRNIRNYFKWGTWPGMIMSGIDSMILRSKTPWDVHNHNQTDNECTLPIKEVTKIEYPKPDGITSFDILTNLARSGTNHQHDQPAHLQLRDHDVPQKINLPVYGGPEQYFCPAKVYEYVDDEQSTIGKRLQINAQNCLHCKACDIKDTTQNIDYTTPEGGGGPAYNIM
ncbi:electron transfer flavoprotein-ubiquinone oxidoreductase, mitochondrial [Acrasis kona]|uniref:Electron transfer flavoprotein-ubiquinone oxidoreductase n=1 Tax=Acrasis kona TaxID=1008807 RepID=A0AAW2YXX9_9EUKA